jgi:iron complex transport system permease protein
MIGTLEKTVITIPKNYKFRTWLFTGLWLLLGISFLISACSGAVKITPAQLTGIITRQMGFTDVFSFEEQQAVIFTVIRLPRICLGLMVGAGLAMSGAALQGLFRNPLADSGLIGISSGASLAAVLMIVLEIKFFDKLSGLSGSYALVVVSFLGACLTTLIVYQTTRKKLNNMGAAMLMIGIAINAISGSFTGLLTYLATDEQLRNITFWTLGSLGGASWNIVLVVFPFMLISLLCIPRLAKSLNLLSLGENQAMLLGVNLAVLRRQVIVCATLAVGTSVAVAGIIGFIGLVVPHIIRLLVGSDHKQVLTGSALGGAAILTLADTISRTIVAPAELPIGIVTAFLGAPFFLWMLLKQKQL